MINILHSKGTPFIGQQAIYNHSMYIRDLRQFALLCMHNDYLVTGHSSNLDKNSLIKSAIGEWIERKSLYSNSFIDDFVYSVSLVNGSVYKVEKGMIIFNENGNFNDSCGVASHLNSKDALINGFLEFFERQSLVYNWLTKSQGTKINLDNNEFSNDYAIQKLLSAAYKYTEHITLINISIHKDIYVVLCIAYGEYHKGVGCSAHWDKKEAVRGALEELYQTFSNKWTKNNVKCYMKESTSNKENLYLSYYVSLDPLELKDKYEYLLNSPFETDNQYKNNYEVNFNTIVKNISKDLGIDILCSFIPTFSPFFKTKILKVFSLQGYPHMYPVLFDEKTSKLNFGKKIQVIQTNTNRYHFHSFVYVLNT